MTTAELIAELEAIEKRCEAATKTGLIRMRFDHGGGRMYSTPDGKPDTMPRNLVIDCYEEADREFYFNAVDDIQWLIAALKAAEDRAERLQGMLHDGAWRRERSDEGDPERTYLMVRMPDGADLSCKATRDAAIEAALAAKGTSDE